MRGYYIAKHKLDGYKDGTMDSYYFYPDERINQMKKYMPVKKPIYMREFPASWRDIDKEIDGGIRSHSKEIMVGGGGAARAVNVVGGNHILAKGEGGTGKAGTDDSSIVGESGRTRSLLAQNFLEYSPYYDHSRVKVNTVVSTERIVGPKATGETCHIIIDHEGDFPYIEGQSVGIIPPGNSEKDGKPHAAQFYSIASSRYGDSMTGATLSLTVERATYWSPELQADDPAKKGVCSNFFCDTTPGSEVMMTGPNGKVMLMPEKDPTTDYIMVATGTGIAPFRGFVRRLFFENTPAANAYKGQQAWLFLEVENSDALLYDDEFRDAKARYPDNFRLDYVLSRETQGVYIQDKIEEYADEIFDKLTNGAHIYFSGLEGMMPGIHNMLASICESKGIDYKKWMRGLRGKGSKKVQWHEEVYDPTLYDPH
ncbi:hypothetical protein ACHAXR_001910 [Thalassiosira sp. AJA248-18]